MKFVTTRSAALVATAVVAVVGLLTFAGAQETSGPVAVADSPLLTEPRDDAERLEAAVLMLRLGRDGLARRYVGQILDGEATDEELLELRDRFGTAPFVTLSRAESLDPLGRRLLDRVDRAFRDAETDEVRVGRLVAALDGPSAESAQASDALVAGGANAAPALVNALFSPASDRQEDRLIDVLARIGEPARRPVEVATRSTATTFVARLITTIERLGVGISRPVLQVLAADPNRPAGTRELAARALDYDAAVLADRHAIADELAAAALDAQRRSLTDGDDAARGFRWDDDLRRLRIIETTTAADALLRAERLVDSAARIAPSDPRVPPARLSVNCRRLVLDEIPAETASIEIAPEGITRLTEAAELAASLGDGRSAALAMRGVSRVLTPAGVFEPAGAAVIELLDSPSPELRLAAAEALVAARPRRSHRNASAVPRVFARGLSADRRVAVVIDAVPSRSSLVTGYFNELGYVADAAADGRTGFQAATDDGVVSLIAIHVGVTRPDLRTLVHSLKADVRTASVQIVIYGDEIFRGRVARMARRYDGCDFVTLTPVRDAFLRQVRALIVADDGTTRPVIADADDYRRRCVEGLRAIASASLDIYPLENAVPALEAAAADPELGPAAVETLSRVPTAAAQRVLAEQVLRSRRGGPGEAFLSHVRTYGTLLPPAMVESLITIGQGGGEDPRLQAALAAFRGILASRPGF